jgi:serine/threonine protein kinase
MVRLKQRFPDTPHENLAQRARKLVDKVFPVFLTREAAFLRLLHRDLPEDYRDRVPHVLGVERGPDGLVRQLCMNWLHLGATPLPQLAFARQLTDLVRVLHDVIHLIHLDLRMDNVVISDHGVCLVDFGSAVRMDEDLSRSPMLATLFGEMMSTSQIQRLLGRMKDAGEVTSKVLVEGHQKIDRAADLFNLAVQMAEPHRNPDLRPLIDFDPESREARQIKQLSERILKPIEPNRPRHRTAADILADLDRIADGESIVPTPAEEESVNQ